MPSSVVETGVVANRTADFVVVVFAGARFGGDDRIARSVGREAHILAIKEEEETAVRAIAVTVGVLVGDTSCSAVAVAFGVVRAVVRVVESGDAVGHAVSDVRRTAAVVVTAAEEYERAVV